MTISLESMKNRRLARRGTAGKSPVLFLWKIYANSIKYLENLPSCLSPFPSRLLGLSLPLTEHPMRRLLPLALALSLGGCSLLPMESDPFDASVAVHSWQLEGKMTFRCDYDEQGFFWRFVSQSGTLTNENRETVATLSGNLKLAHRDGSSVSAHVEKSLSPATSRNAGDVRYLVDRGAASGALRGVRYLTRIRTTGGMPLASCSASQRDTTLRIPFSARFIVYR